MIQQAKDSRTTLSDEKYQQAKIYWDNLGYSQKLLVTDELKMYSQFVKENPIDFDNLSDPQKRKISKKLNN